MYVYKFDDIPLYCAYELHVLIICRPVQHREHSNTLNLDSCSCILSIGIVIVTNFFDSGVDCVQVCGVKAKN